mmetsp:Transcript_4708/g.10711  ORF Transcript_4708/g.10711 Transcript_4708/m.10711 type:complete len:95 (+) Transcript_4708:118-402(+)
MCFNSSDILSAVLCYARYCGPKFIQAAGASRRAAGIVSDISRDAALICPIGWYAGCMACHAACGSYESGECTAACAERCDLPAALGVSGPRRHG